VKAFVLQGGDGEVACAEANMPGLGSGGSSSSSRAGAAHAASMMWPSAAAHGQRRVCATPRALLLFYNQLKRYITNFRFTKTSLNSSVSFQFHFLLRYPPTPCSRRVTLLLTF